MLVVESEPDGPGSSPFSVFADDSGAKHRRVRRVGRLLGLGLLAYALVLLAGVVRPLPFSGARLPPATQDGPVRLWTVPSVPERAEGGHVGLGPAPAPDMETAAPAGTEVAAAPTRRTATGTAEPPAVAAASLPPPAPAPPPPPPPAASGEAVVAGRSAAAPRSGAVPGAVPSGRSEVSAVPPATRRARQPSPASAPAAQAPGEPGPDRTTGR